MLTLVGRELCLFLHLDASRVPARQRDAFLALAIRRAAPFADPEHDALWLDGHAAAWYWSRARVRQLAGNGTRFRAEALYRGERREGEALELLALATTEPRGEPVDHGVEARAWRGGRLVASRWWPRLPDAEAWAGFARGAGAEASVPRPEPAVAPLRATPLHGTAGRASLAGELGARRPLVAAVAATLALALLAWQAGGWARAAWRTHLLERETAQLSARMEAIIDARARADAARARIDAMLALRTPASQTRLLAEAKRVTPGTWQLLLWRQPAPDLLEVTLRATNPDVPAIVAAWEASPLFQEVTPGAGRADALTLQARLTPIQAQLAATP